MDATKITSSKIRILAVDSSPIFLVGLREQFSTLRIRAEMVAETCNIHSAVDLVAALEPHIVLMEVSLKSAAIGIEATRKIKNNFPNTKILLFSEDDSTDLIVKALQAGANGFLVKSMSIRELQDAIISIYNNGTALSPAIAQKLVSVLTHPIEKAFEPTDRELEILKLTSHGLSNIQIAKDLYLSTRTVEAHLHHIFQKLGVNSRTEAVFEGIRTGLLESPAAHICFSREFASSTNC